MPDIRDDMEDKEDKDDEYERYCYLCRRPESVAGKLVSMPGISMYVRLHAENL